MGMLETVFRSRKFDLEDDVLIEFKHYFDRRYKDYNSFSLDDEDLPALRRFVQMILDKDCKSKIYVCTYGYEFVDNRGKKLTYADCLWLDTSLALSEIEKLIAESGVPAPSNFSLICDCNEIARNKVWLIAESDNGTPEVLELSDKEKVNRMAQVYWD